MNLIEKLAISALQRGVDVEQLKELAQHHADAFWWTLIFSGIVGQWIGWFWIGMVILTWSITKAIRSIMCTLMWRLIERKRTEAKQCKQQ